MAAQCRRYLCEALMAASDGRAASGAGPGEITRDGCAVDVYARLPASGEPEIIHTALTPGASVLDLGCGTGRIADPLVRLGHEVVAVDESPAMLAHVRAARTVCGEIESLDLGRRFGGVALASHLVNTPDGDARSAMLATAARHVDRAGQVVVQWHPPDWLDGLDVGHEYGGSLGPVRTVLRVLAFDGEVLDAVVEYRAAGSRWEHRFRCRRLSEADMVCALEAAGLHFGRWLTADRRWFAAGRSTPAETRQRG